MTNRARGICQQPGCATRTTSSYCETHRQRDTTTATRLDSAGQYEQAEARRIRSSRRWQKVRDAILSEAPFCRDPHERHAVPVLAAEVHHVVPVARAPSLAFDADNLMPVCRVCHELIEREGKGGSNL